MAGKKIDINKAAVEEFATLVGIGHAKAEAIVEARQANGGFASISSLLEIPGIGPWHVEQNRGRILCSRASSAQGPCRRLDKDPKKGPSMDSQTVSPQPHSTDDQPQDSPVPGSSTSAPHSRSRAVPRSSSVGDAPSKNTRSCKVISEETEVSDTSSTSESIVGHGEVCTPSDDQSDNPSTPCVSPADSDDMDCEGDKEDSPSGAEDAAGYMSDLPHSPVSPEKPWMKRKSDGGGTTTELTLGKKPRGLSQDGDCPDYGSAASLRVCLAAMSASNNASSIRRQRIPSKENPPPELANWLKTYREWSHAERLLALDELIELCEPTQVRHLMAVIEPQFQRDFISLLPKELALYVLSFLEPRDLLRAAQTCRYWRILAEDNLLWREKCREESIDEATVFENRVRRKSEVSGGSAAKCPWKNLYLRQKTIEHNWRASSINSPKVLKGHDDHVITCLEFSGTKIVSGSDDNTLKVWSAVSGKCLRTLVGHTGGVWSSQMAGNIIISGSTDRTLKVWNADTGQCTHTLYGHTSTVRCMHLHKSKVVSGSRDATLRVWNVESGQCLHVLMGHMAAVRCVQYDGKRVVSGAYDYTVRVWDPETESCVHILNGHTNRVYSLQFDGVHIVSGSLDTSIRVWDVESGNCLHTLIGHQSLTSGMELKDSILVSGNADSTVKVWDITTGQCLQTLQGTNKHQSAVTCLQFNKKFVITSSDDGSVKIWDLKAGDFLRNLVALDSGGSGGVVWRIRCSNTKLVCAVGSRNGTEETKLLVLDFDVDDSDSGSKHKSNVGSPNAIVSAL